MMPDMSQHHMQRPTPESFEAWNEQMSIKYNPDHYHDGANPLLRFIEGRRTRAILRGLSIKKTDRVLDIGCGAGNMLARIDAVRTGTDLADIMIERAKAKLGDTVELHKMAAEHMNFPDASFDKIICSEVIEHLLDPRLALMEINRLLRPNGLAAISIPNEDLIEKTKSALRRSGLSFLMKNEGETNLDETENEWHLQYASLQKFQEWNKDLLQIVQIMRIPFPFLPFRYVFICKKKI